MDWIKIADEQVRHIWVCQTGKCLKQGIALPVDPSSYANSGIPLCTECDTYLAYSQTEILTAECELIEALRRDGSYARVSNGSRWLIWDDIGTQWIVYSREPYQKRNRTIAETRVLSEAVDALMGDCEDKPKVKKSRKGGDVGTRSRRLFTSGLTE